MPINRWQGNDTRIFRIDTDKGPDGAKAIIYAPRTAHNGELEHMLQLLEENHYSVHFDYVERSDPAVTIKIDDAADLQAVQEYFAANNPDNRCRLEQDEKGDSVTIRGFQTGGNDQKEAYEALKGLGLKATRTRRTLTPEPVLSVRGFEDDSQLFRLLHNNGFVNDERPIDPMAGMNLFQRFMDKVEKDPGRMGGFIYMPGSLSLVRSGLVRGNMGETMMGLGYVSGNSSLILGPGKDERTSHIFDAATKDFLQRDGTYDMSAKDVYGKGEVPGGAAVNAFETFRRDNYSEFKSSLNTFSGFMSMRGGLLDRKSVKILHEREEPSFIDKVYQFFTGTERGRIGDVALNDEGKALIKKRIDAPLVASGALLATGFGVAAFVPPKGSGKTPLIDPSAITEQLPDMNVRASAEHEQQGEQQQNALKENYDKLTQDGVGKAVREQLDKVHENPRKFAGNLGRIHNVQQIFFALREALVTTPLTLRAYRKKFKQDRNEQFGDSGLLDKKGEFKAAVLEQDKRVIEEYEAKEARHTELQGEHRTSLKINANSLPSAELQMLNELERSYDDALYRSVFNLDDKHETVKHNGKLFDIEAGYEKFIRRHETKLDDPYGQVEPGGFEEQRYVKALNRENAETTKATRWRFAYRLFFAASAFMGNTLFGRIDRHKVQDVNQARFHLDMNEIYDRGANFIEDLEKSGQLQESGVSKQQAIENLAESLRNKPEIDAKHINVDTIARGIMNNMAGRSSDRMLISQAMERNPWVSQEQQQAASQAYDERLHNMAFRDAVDRPKEFLQDVPDQYIVETERVAREFPMVRQ